jgi:iron complex outermembrane receptor protein
VTAAAVLWLAIAAEPARAGKELIQLSLEQLMDVSILGASKYEQKQGEVAAAVSVISRQEIKTFGWRTLADALSSLPGVHTTYDRQYSYLGNRGLGLPGDYSKRILVTIDGNRVNDPGYDGGPVGRQFPLDMDMIERIEFIPGPGGAVYGQNAMFGVVNVITRHGADVDGTELALAYQSPQSLTAGRASWGKVLDNGVDVTVSVSGLRSRGEDRFYEFGSLGVSGIASGMDGERYSQFFARVARGPWSADVVHSNRRKDDPAANNQSDPLVPGQYQADGYTLSQLRYDGNPDGDGWYASARLFAGEERYRSILSYGGSAMSFPETSDWYGAELRLMVTAVAGHKLMLGVEAQKNVRYNQSIIDLANPANDIFIPGSGYRLGVYAQDEWSLGQGLTATLGLRLDRNSVTGRTASPRAGLIWQAAPTTTFKALFGRAHRAPNTLERDYYDGVAYVANPALQGEQVDTAELVVDHWNERQLALRASLYRWTMRGLITQGIDPVSTLTQYHSGEKVKADGLELSADQTWHSGARLRGSISLQNVAYASGPGLLNSPNLLTKLNLSTPLPMAGLRLGYELHYDSRRLTLDGSSLGGYALSNLHLSTSALAKGLELSLGVYNLFDKRYAQPGAIANWQNALEQDGRSVLLKGVYSF